MTENKNRNCKNCMHRESGFSINDYCTRFQEFSSMSIFDQNHCGRNLSEWTAKPVRRSLRKWLYDTLWK